MLLFVGERNVTCTVLDMLNALCLGNSSPYDLDAAQKGLLAKLLHTELTEGETIFKIGNVNTYTVNVLKRC